MGMGGVHGQGEDGKRVRGWIRNLSLSSARRCATPLTAPHPPESPYWKCVCHIFADTGDIPRPSLRPLGAAVKSDRGAGRGVSPTTRLAEVAASRHEVHTALTGAAGSTMAPPYPRDQPVRNSFFPLPCIADPAAPGWPDQATRHQHPFIPGQGRSSGNAFAVTIGK